MRFAVLIVLLLTGPVSAAPSDRAVPPPRDPDNLGRGVQRTMTLLATSTAGHPNRVRVLFYGQSITEQDWWKRVADDLKQRFPHADLDIRNRAIGGFASQLLVRPAEHDVFPFYPDLVIFHVYGSDTNYEQIIRGIRSRTTAEVLMQTDHLTKRPPATIDEKQDKGAWWDERMNRQFLPATTKKYGCGLCDVRGGWADYLKAHGLEPKDLLKDGVHLNDHGCYLMGELVRRHLVYHPELADTIDKDSVTWVPVRPGSGGAATIEFDGNRVDVLPAAGGATAVTIDGRKPSEWHEAYFATRPAPGPWSPLFLSRVDRAKPVVLEDWTLKLTDVAADGKTWRFAVRGSVTGPDGEGASDTPFVSNSGRVKIDPAAWFRNPNVPLTTGYEVTWSVKGVFADTYTPPATAGNRGTTVVQGIPPGRHTLTLTPTVGGALGVAAVRVYRPPNRPPG